MGNGTTRFIWHRAKLIRAGLLAFASLAMAGAAAAKCSDTSVTLRGDWGQARYAPAPAVGALFALSHQLHDEVTSLHDENALLLDENARQHAEIALLRAEVEALRASRDEESK